MSQINRGRKLTFTLVLMVLLIPAFNVYAILEESNKFENQDLNQGMEMFSQARKMFYNAEDAIAEVRKLLEMSRKTMEKAPDGWEKSYQLAQIEFMLGEMAEYPGDKKAAAEHFTESNRLSSQALEENPNSSEATRLLSDTIMRLMPYKGGFYTMSQGPKALNMVKKALSLDPKNYTAMNSLGVYYLNAPAIGGGSTEKGIRILQQALESKDEFDNFISNVWLGRAYQKKKNQSKAEKYFQKALQIYPNSPWVKGMLK